MPITYSATPDWGNPGPMITVSGYSQASPITWEDIYQASLLFPVSGLITKLSPVAYRFNSVLIKFGNNGWIRDFNKVIIFAGIAGYRFRSESALEPCGSRIGRWDAVNRMGVDGCKFYWADITGPPINGESNGQNWPFVENADCEFNGCEWFFAGTTYHNVVSSNAESIALTLRDCKMRSNGGLVQFEALQDQGEIIKLQITRNVDNGAEFLWGTRYPISLQEITLPYDYSPSDPPGTVVIKDLIFLEEFSRIRMRSGRIILVSPRVHPNQERVIFGQQESWSFTLNTELRLTYRYNLTVNAFLGAGLDDARLAIFAAQNTQADFYTDVDNEAIANYAIADDGVFAQITVIRWIQTVTNLSPITVTTQDLGPHKFVVGKFGYQRIEYNINNPRTYPDIRETKELQPIAVTLTESEASAVDYVAVTHNTQTITVSGSSRSLTSIHSYLQWLAVQNGQMRFPVLANKQGAQITTPYNWSIASALVPSGFELVIPDSRTISLTTAGDYSSGPVLVRGTVAVSGGATDLSTWKFETAIIDNLSASPATVAIGTGQEANLAIANPTTGGGSVTLVAPTIALSAPFFADGTRVQVSRVENFTVAHTTINTTTNQIALTGNQFTTSGFPTLVRFTKAAGATLPTSSPQIEDGGLYYVVAVDGANVRISETQGGAPLDFSAQGSGNFAIAGITELSNSVVSGGSGLSLPLAQPNGTLLRVRARHWSASLASRFFDQVYVWSNTAGVIIPDTLSAAATPDRIYNAIVAADYIVGSDGTQYTTTNDGSAVQGLAVEADGTVEIDINDEDGRLLIQDAYAWFVWVSSTQSGIRLISADNVVAEDLFNYVLARIKLESVSSIPVTVVGGYLRSGDNSPLITTQSNPLHLNAQEKGVAIAVATGGSSLTPAEIWGYSPRTLSPIGNQAIATEAQSAMAVQIRRINDLWEDALLERKLRAVWAYVMQIWSAQRLPIPLTAEQLFVYILSLVTWIADGKPGDDRPEAGLLEQQIDLLIAELESVLGA